MKNYRYLVCLVLTLTILFNIVSQADASYLSPNNSQTFDNTITNVQAIELTSETTRSAMVEEYLEAVATIIIYENETDTAVSMGSGVAVYSGGYIATNWHVISNVDLYPTDYYIKIEVIYNGELTIFNADLLWSSDIVDLAVIRSEYHNIPYVTMEDRWINSDNRLRIAEEIWTLGTPYDMSLFGTYSEGYISSNLERLSSSDGRLYESMIQHSSAISNGSSGSGLFDANGSLLGLNTLGVPSTSTTSANDLYFSTPIYPIINIIDDIASLEEDNDPETNYSFPKIGVNGYDRNMSNTFSDSGLYTMSVNSSGPSSGLLFEGDVLTGISTPTATETSTGGYYEVDIRNDFFYAISNFNKGDSVKLYVKNSVGLNRVVEVVLG